ncbi:DUF536 domain-containing protein [Pseudomonas aeruginosa]|uniref:DUF536 domain-containing protein n=1 Tax=Pseudomonas aeruginosa TaxID=287 RepID=UPI00106CD481|nr:DUF536 domain-containing protein [Pseudomonas aeruginosa]
MSPITIVLRSGMGMHIDSVRPYLRNGMPIAIGRAGAVISHFADGDAHLALRTIAEFPCPEQDNMPAANMRQIALAALSGAGASSEPGNPGGEPVSGPGNAGERPHPAPGSGDSKLAESLQTLVRWLDRAEIEDGYVGVPVIEAVEVVVNELRRLQAEVADWQEAAGRSRSDVVAYIAERAKLLEERDSQQRLAIKAMEEVAALRSELQTQRERNTELIFKLGSATNGWGRCEKERDAALARAAELEGKLAELEKPVPTHGEHSELRRIAVALKNPLLSGEEASDLMVRYEALTMPDHIIALIDRQAQHSVPEGWKLVPVEPTPEMLDARRDCEDGMDGYLVEDTEYYFPDRGAVRAFLARVYQGLIAAAPAPGGER